MPVVGTTETSLDLGQREVRKKQLQALKAEIKSLGIERWENFVKMSINGKAKACKTAYYPHSGKSAAHPYFRL